MGFLYKNSKLLKTILDSLEEQEGGAMYISCDVSNGGPVEPEMGYVPNNPLFGLALESPQGNTSLSSLHSNDFDCGSCFDAVVNDLGSTQSHSQGNLIYMNSTSYWNSDEMASTFPGLPPLEIDPLPSLFPFSPCGASYNFPTNPHHASLSYTVHPHQMLVSPSNHSQTQVQSSTVPNGSAAQTCYYDPTLSTAIAPTGSSGCNPHLSAASAPQPPMYPSMSVNVSMNMTMHGYGADGAVPMPCSQMQWTPPNSASSVNVLYPPLLSPSHYPAATYSFTADFRTPTLQNSQTSTNAIAQLSEPVEKQSLSPTNRNILPNLQVGQSFSPPIKSPIFSQLRDAKSFESGGVFDEEDSNDETSEAKSNLCRLCGKTYARPSTLKTHLRTHSGERPYRCPDCNKSFSQAANLTAHVRTHTGQKPFRCPICDRRFSQSSSVTTHMRTHSGERPYRCSSCKKSFSDSSTLTKHLRIHSGEKPYQCKLCLLRFSQSGNLNRHMRVHGTNNNGSMIT